MNSKGAPLTKGSRVPGSDSRQAAGNGGTTNPDAPVPGQDGQPRRPEAPLNQSVGAGWDKAVHGVSIAISLVPLAVLAGWHAHIRAFSVQSWRVVPLEALITIAGVALITLVVKGLTAAKVACKGIRRPTAICWG